MKENKKFTHRKKEKIYSKDNMFTKDTISLDDKKNKQCLDDFAYKVYLINLNSESSDNDE